MRLSLFLCLSFMVGTALADVARPVMQSSNTKALTDDLATGAKSLKISAAGNLVWEDGAGFTGAAYFRTAAGLSIGTNVQPYDDDLDVWAGITPTGDVQILLGAADNAAMRTALGLGIGVDVQAYDAQLTTWAGITPGTGVATALGNAVDGASGLLTYGMIGTSGAKLPLLNAANTFSAAQIIDGGTITSSAPLLSITQEWNNGSEQFFGIVKNFIMTGAAYNSRVEDWRASGSSIVWFDRYGTIRSTGGYFDTAYDGTQLAGIGSFGLNLLKSAPITWSSSDSYSNSPDTYLYREAAGVISVRNSTSAQSLRVSHTWTDANNWEAFVIDSQTLSNIYLVGPQAGSGGGSLRTARYSPDGSTFWTSGSGSPEGVVTAPVGSMYTRTDGSAGTTLYVKESGTGNTGWTAK